MHFNALIIASMAAIMGARAELEWEVSFYTSDNCQGDVSAVYGSGNDIEDSGCMDIDTTVKYKYVNLIADSGWVFELGDASGCECSSSFHGILSCPEQHYGNDIGTGECITDISNWKSWTLSKN